MIKIAFFLLISTIVGFVGCTNFKDKKNSNEPKSVLHDCPYPEINQYLEKTNEQYKWKNGKTISTFEGDLKILKKNLGLGIEIDIDLGDSTFDKVVKRNNLSPQFVEGETQIRNCFCSQLQFIQDVGVNSDSIKRELLCNCRKEVYNNACPSLYNSQSQSSSSYDQKKRVIAEGFLINENSNARLPNTKVCLSKYPQVCDYTDSDGHFKLESSNPKIFTHKYIRLYYFVNDTIIQEEWKIGRKNINAKI